MDQPFRLVDPHGRSIHKLRVQLTDACNFRCFYCMPRDVKFHPPADLLLADEFFEICSHLAGYGIDEIRLSGGEPTLRKDFEEIVSRISSLPLRKLGLTTNAYILDEKIPFLKTTNCRHINISLDSLQEKKFQAITRSRYFHKVVHAVALAREAGFSVKVNAVLMRGVNDDEVFDFLEFSKRHDVEVRFLELMKIGESRHLHTEQFMPAQEIIQRIEEKETLIPQSVNRDSTSFNFMTPGGARVGFIASESQPFCCFCSRWRLTATGRLRACLMSEAGVNLRGVPLQDYPHLLKAVLAMKPTGRIEEIKQPMYQIGG